jgi:glycerate kinase
VHAVVEMADVSVLRLFPPDRLAPLTATTYRTREAVRAALDRGCRTIVLGIGGSASTDGGAGMLEALGGRLFDAAGTSGTGPVPVPRAGSATRRWPCSARSSNRGSGWCSTSSGSSTTCPGRPW